MNVNRLLFATIVAGLLLLLPRGGDAFASNQIAKDTGLVCTACHDKPGSKLLTDKGKYFETMGDLEGFDELTTMFGRCTNCHVKKPGSTELTRDGRRYARLVENMEGMRELIASHHPSIPVVVEEGEMQPKGDSPEDSKPDGGGTR